MTEATKTPLDPCMTLADAIRSHQKDAVRIMREMAEHAPGVPGEDRPQNLRLHVNAFIDHVFAEQDTRAGMINRTDDGIRTTMQAARDARGGVAINDGADELAERIASGEKRT